MTVVNVGVLALQGDFAEHKKMIENLGVSACLVKHAADIDAVDGLIIPGGESTAIVRLTSFNGNGLFAAIIRAAKNGMPVFGTCMGAIFLSKEIEGSGQGRLALMDIKVRRNAFGCQKYSRQEFLPIPALGDEPFPLVFIRGPLIVSCGADVDILASVAEGIVMARQANLLACAFHPELTADDRVHRYFLEMIRSRRPMTGSARVEVGQAALPAAAR